MIHEKQIGIIFLLQECIELLKKFKIIPQRHQLYILEITQVRAKINNKLFSELTNLNF